MRADDTPDYDRFEEVSPLRYPDVDEQLLADYPELQEVFDRLAARMDAEDAEPCCTYRDHGRGGCACPEHARSAMHPFGS